jgi:hypothetical protein
MKMRVVPIFLLLLFAAPIIHQTSATQNQNQFSSTLRARVTDDLSREGVSTVRVTVTGTGITQPLVSTTDADGNLQINGLAGGRYSLAIDKAGYFPQTFPDIVVGSFEVGNQPTNLGDLNITAQRNASGTVKWTDGEPVTNAIVHVMSFRGGAYSRAPFVNTVQTNERGEFKVEGLRARRYMLFAFQRPQVVAPGTAVRVALPVFYPGVERPENAQMLDMRTMREAGGLSLVMKEERGVSIEGKVTSDTLMPGVPAQLGLINPGIPTPFMVGTETRVGEAFRLYPVPPGSYLLFARGINPPPPPTPGTTATANTVPPPLEPAVTAIPVVVNRDSPIRDLNVNLPPATVLEGKVELEEAVEGQPTKIVPGTGVNFFFEWLPKMESNYGFVTGGVNDKGEFRLPGAVRGQAYITGPGSSWGNAYLASLKQGQKDLLVGALPVVAGGDPIHVLLKRDGGRVGGKVRDGSNTPWRAFVVVAPRDRRIEFSFRTAFTMSDGTFQISNIPPGEYDIFAFDRNDEDIYYSGEFLQRYAVGGTRINIAPNSIQLVELSVTHTAK